MGAFLAASLPIAAGLLRFTRLSNAQRSILAYCVVAFVLDAFASGLWWFSIPNLFIGHINTIVEFLLLANAYRITFARRGPVPWMHWCMVLFTLVAIANSIVLQDVHQFNTYIKILESGLLIAFSLRYFQQLARDLKVHHLESHPFFWINTAILVYFSSNLFVFLYSNYLLYYSQTLGIQIWLVHALFLILFYAILSIGLWIAPKSSTSHG